MDKPRGFTSHDVVAVVRRALPGAKVGHAGTLDPDATGVLVICVGKATKIAAFLMEGTKEYRGVGRLGVVTDTQDATGTTLEEHPVAVTEEGLREAAAELTGVVEQVPPMYSAVKVDGQRLYRLARKGVEVERPARRVTIHSFDIGAIDLPTFEFSLQCSKGTYVRTVVHDLGARLGCGAHLASLVRGRQGTFTEETAVPWEALRSEDAASAIRDASVSPREALAFLPQRRQQGPGAVPRTGDMLAAGPGDEEGKLVCVRSVEGWLAVGRAEADGVRVLHVLPGGRSFGRGKRAP